jgi:hypothetical protein
MLESYRITARLVADLAWPVVALLLVWLILRRYPEEIRNLFVRLLGFKTPVASANFGPPVQDTGTTEPEPSTQATSASNAPDGQANQLQSQLQEAWNAWHHEVTFRTIYGTQIELIRFLNNVAYATASDLDGFYQRHLIYARTGTPNYLYPRENYLGYLLLRGLVVQTMDHYSITDVGQDFLLYLTRMRIPEYRAY